MLLGGRVVTIQTKEQGQQDVSVKVLATKPDGLV